MALTKSQFRCVELLALREGRIVQRWAFFGGSVFGDDQESINLDVHLCRARKAFREVDPEFAQIENVRGEGFIWVRTPANPAVRQLESLNN